MEKIVRAYYRIVQSKLSSLEHLAVDVPGLGVFAVKGRRLETKINKVNGLLESIKGLTSLRSYSIRAEQNDQLTKLKILHTRWLNEQVRRRAIRQSRYEKPADHLQE